MSKMRAFATFSLYCCVLLALSSCAGDGKGLTEAGDPVGGVLTATVSAARDNTLYEDDAGALSNAKGNYFFVGTVGGGGQGKLRRGILIFDVAAVVPPGATVTEAELTLFLSKRADPSGPVTMDVHRCQLDWSEGTSTATNPAEGSGGPSTTGDATWIHNAYATSMWTNAGGDFDATASASRTVDLVGSYTWSGGTLTADVQDMLDNPAGNFGWILIGDESRMSTAKRFHSSENVEVNRRPLLTVRYTE